MVVSRRRSIFPRARDQNTSAGARTQSVSPKDVGHDPPGGRTEVGALTEPAGGRWLSFQAAGGVLEFRHCTLRLDLVALTYMYY